MGEADAFEYGARYRTRCAIDAMRDRFAAGEVLVYWRYASSHHDDARGWFFRQGPRVVRSYDLFGGETLRRDELFERLEGPRPIVVAVAAGDAAAIEREARAAESDADAALDLELAAELALERGHEAAFATLLSVASFTDVARTRLLHEAARRGRAASIAALLATGIAADAGAAREQTALVAAVAGGHVDAARVLLDAGADPDRAQPGGTTARRFARDARVIELLARHAR